MNEVAFHPAPSRASLAFGVLIAAILAGAAVAGLAIEQALQWHQPWMWLGLIPAAVIVGGVGVLGLRPWPAWSKFPASALMLASAAFFLITGYLEATGRASSDAFPASAGVLAGCVFMGLLFFAGGWVYRDAQRRGLNAGGWAAITILIFPDLIGLIAYLIIVVLRDQQAAVCAGCGARLPGNLAYCIRCGHQSRAACPQCQAPAVAGAAFCGHCGATLAGGTGK